MKIEINKYDIYQVECCVQVRLCSSWLPTCAYISTENSSEHAICILYHKANLMIPWMRPRLFHGLLAHPQRQASCLPLGLCKEIISNLWINGNLVQNSVQVRSPHIYFWTSQSYSRKHQPYGGHGPYPTDIHAVTMLRLCSSLERGNNLTTWEPFALPPCVCNTWDLRILSHVYNTWKSRIPYTQFSYD